MPEITEAHIESLITACGQNAAGIAESLNLCFDCKVRIEPGESLPWNAESTPSDLDGPGLVVAFEIGEQGMICLIPASLPLPEWYVAPGDSQQARLQTLSMEWSMNMLPADLTAERYQTTASDNLKAEVIFAGPVEWAAGLELRIFEESEADSEAAPEPTARLYLVWPVAKPPFPSEEEPSVEPVVQQSPETTPDAVAVHPRDQRLLNLLVTISVRLAEKKIEMGQLLTLTPGALVVFNKSCESLLDLYVNNHLHCRGEAVKIGEKFGLKINEVEVEDVREQKIL